MKYFFSDNQIKLFRNIITNDSIRKKIENSFLNNRIYNNKYPTNKYFVEFSKTERDVFIDELTFLLTSKGFNDNYKPTSLGQFIEDLIDKLLSNQQQIF